MEAVAFALECAEGNVTGPNGNVTLHAPAACMLFVTVIAPEEVRQRDTDVSRYVLPVHQFVRDRALLDTFHAWAFADVTCAAEVTRTVPTPAPAAFGVLFHADDGPAVWDVDATFRRDAVGPAPTAVRVLAVADGVVTGSTRFAWGGGGGDGAGPASFRADRPPGRAPPSPLAGTAVAAGGVTVTWELDQAP